MVPVVILWVNLTDEELGNFQTWIAEWESPLLSQISKRQEQCFPNLTAFFKTLSVFRKLQKLADLLKYMTYLCFQKSMHRIQHFLLSVD